MLQSPPASRSLPSLILTAKAPKSFLVSWMKVHFLQACHLSANTVLPLGWGHWKVPPSGPAYCLSLQEEMFVMQVHMGQGDCIHHVGLHRQELGWCRKPSERPTEESRAGMPLAVSSSAAVKPARERKLLLGSGRGRQAGSPPRAAGL